MPTPEAVAVSDAVGHPTTGKYLKFKRLNDLCDHLARHGATCVHFDDVAKHDTTDQDAIGSVAVYAVASQDLGTHVAVWSQVVGREWDVFLHGKEEMEAFRAKARHHLEHFQALLEGKGLRVLPGIWSHEPPRFLYAA